MKIALEQRRKRFQSSSLYVVGSVSPAVAFDLNGNLAGGFGYLKPVSILIVDDFEPWRRAVRSILAEDAYLEVVGESPDGLDAVQKSEAMRPDLVLLDIQLPTMSGFDAAQRISKVSPNTKILFVSSYHCVEVMREALRIGAGFVVKADAARDLLPIVQATVRDEPFLRFRFLGDGPADPDLM